MPEAAAGETGIAELSSVEGVGPEAEAPRLITTLQYRLDDVGFLADQRTKVFVLELPDVRDADSFFNLPGGDDDHDEEEDGGKRRR